MAELEFLWDSSSGSCKDRCFELAESEPPHCRCDNLCKTYYSCCLDFDKHCLKTGVCDCTLQCALQSPRLSTTPGGLRREKSLPKAIAQFCTGEQLVCSQIDCSDSSASLLLPDGGFECSENRCGEVRNEDHACHCSDDCVENADCCTNYKAMCKGEGPGVVLHLVNAHAQTTESFSV